MLTATVCTLAKLACILLFLLALLHKMFSFIPTAKSPHE